MSTNNIKGKFSGPVERILERAPEAFTAAGYPLVGAIWIMKTDGQTNGDKLRALARLALTPDLQAGDDSTKALRAFLVLCGTLTKDPTAIAVGFVDEALRDVVKLENSAEASHRRGLVAQSMASMATRH